MNKDWLVASLIMLLTLFGALYLLRTMAPGLIGIPVDLQMVGISEKVPPFFENVFRTEDLLSKDYIIKDPLVGVRAQPLFPNIEYMGPNDILGFRNRSVPNVADIVVIGDSQTYGNNSAIQKNWPGQMSKQLNTTQHTVVYNMSVGGWGAIQYLYAASQATVFQPNVMIVAYYSGNDPLDSFRMAYNYDVWRDLVKDESLSASDIPSVTFPAPESEQWRVEFRDGIETIFSPTLRLASNKDHPAVAAGYDVMAEAARRIVALAHPKGIAVFFTIIPTKELAYEWKISSENITSPPHYKALIKSEKANIESLAKIIDSIDGAQYVNTVKPLQHAALNAVALYPNGVNGHPVAEGYRIIGKTLATSIQPRIPETVSGLVLVPSEGDKFQPLFVNEAGYWHFPNPTDFEKHGWNLKASPVVRMRNLAHRDYAGVLTPKMITNIAQTEQ